MFGRGQARLGVTTFMSLACALYHLLGFALNALIRHDSFIGTIVPEVRSMLKIVTFCLVAEPVSPLVAMHVGASGAAAGARKCVLVAPEGRA